MPADAKPWRPGESGVNRAPKSPAPHVVLRAMLEEPVSWGDKRTKLQAFWENVYEDAMEGNDACRRLIAERIAPVRLILQGGTEDAPIVRIFTQQRPQIGQSETIDVVPDREGE